MLKFDFPYLQITENDEESLRSILDFTFRPTDTNVEVNLLEIGCWTGYTTSFIGKRCEDLIKEGFRVKLYVIDTFDGSGSELTGCIDEGFSALNQFKNNMNELGYSSFIDIIQEKSEIGIDLFNNLFFDFIFIDGDHRYKSVLNDIKYGLNKLKVGGVLCGHDCELYYKNLCTGNQDIIQFNTNKDSIKVKGGMIVDDEVLRILSDYNTIHPGTIRSLYEQFNGDYKIFPHSSVWMYIKKG